MLALRSQARSLILLERYEEAVGVGRTALAQLGRLPWRLRVRLPQVRTGLLFTELGYRQVWHKLTAGLAGLPVANPSDNALWQARARL